jgi:branched-chain amino acid transport system permease protein
VDILLTGVILGIAIGLVYALVGAALVVIHRTSGYVSFAQGDIASASLYIGLFCYSAGFPYWLTAIVVIVVGALLGGVIGGLIVVPIERFGRLPAALATVGVGLAIQGIEALLLNTEARGFPSIGTGPALTLGPVTLSVADVVGAGVSALLFLGIGIFFARSRTGIAMRAVNDNEAAAAHMGLSAKRLKYLSWIIAGGLAGVTGLFVAPVYGLSPTTVNSLLVFGFATVVLGGFESILGALIAGIVIGVSGNLVAAYAQPALVTFAMYVLVLVILLFRPAGLLGRRRLERV